MNFLDPDSKFSQIMSTIFDYLKLGALFLIFSIPIITAGAAAAGTMYVGMKIARGEAPKLWMPFWQSFRQNFKQATVSTLVLLAIAGLLQFDWYQLLQMESTILIRFARAVVFLATLIVLMAGLYLFPILARFEVTGKQLVRNAVSFGLMNFTNNFLVAAVILAGLWLMDNALPILPAVVAVLPALVIWLMSRICVKTFSKVEVQHEKDNL